MKKTLAIIIALIGVLCLLTTCVGGAMNIIELIRNEATDYLVRAILYAGRDLLIDVALIMTGAALLVEPGPNTKPNIAQSR
jgi:hypothetical protein